jgi:RNA polymerase sigma-70 factor (ECF subfamily)
MGSRESAATGGRNPPPGRKELAMTESPASFDPTATVELVARARGGDERAWEILMRRYRGPLQRFARSRLARQPHRLADTDDVVQDVTINVFRRLHRIELRFPGALLAYLRRSVSNRVADEHRRSVRQGPTATLDDNFPDGHRSPLDATIARDKVRVYRTALLALGADDRLAIVMRLEKGESYDAIAGRLGKPTPNAARVAVARAMFKLAKQMGPLPPRGDGNGIAPAVRPAEAASPTLPPASSASRSCP